MHTLPKSWNVIIACTCVYVEFKKKLPVFHTFNCNDCFLELIIFHIAWQEQGLLQSASCQVCLTVTAKSTHMPLQFCIISLYSDIKFLSGIHSLCSMERLVTIRLSLDMQFKSTGGDFIVLIKKHSVHAESIVRQILAVRKMARL